MARQIPKPAIARLCAVYTACEQLAKEGVSEISSNDLAERLGLAAHNIRKDISWLGEVGVTGTGYAVSALKDHLAHHLGLARRRAACLVGLGRLGSAILEYHRLEESGYSVIAGFDSNMNRLETIHTAITLYPSYELAEVIRRESIEIGIIAVPASAAAQVASDMIEGGIKGIVNFAPVTLSAPGPQVVVRNIDFVNEFRILAAYVSINDAG